MLLLLAANGATAQPRVEPVTIVANAAFPAGIAFASDGTMYFTERGGRVRSARRGKVDREPIASGPTTNAGETGFLGLALSPDERFLYLFATDPSGTSNEVLRVPAGGGKLEEVVTDMPGGGYHNGGGVAFLDDDTLLVTNGETHDSSRAQDPDERGGKVYRFEPDGTPVENVPFGNETYALGLRNPFGIAVDPLSGFPFVTENGPTSHDEIDRIVPGGNYGWPAVSGPAGDVSRIEATLPGKYMEPLLDYPEIIVPTGIAFADPADAQVRFAGNLFFGTFTEQSIHRVRLNAKRDTALSDEIIVEEDEGVVALAWGPGGLYYSTESAIKLLPIAKKTSPGAADVVPVGEDDGGIRVPRLLATVLIVAVFAVAGFVIGRKRRGRAEPGP